MQVANAVSRMRDSDVQKPPGIAEAIDWLAALALLGIEALDAARDRPHARLGAQVRRGPGGRARRRPREARAAAMTDFGVETIELDLPPLAAGFARRLHEAGVPVTPDRAVGFARALGLDAAGVAAAAVLDRALGVRLRPGARRGVRPRVRRRVRREQPCRRARPPEDVSGADGGGLGRRAAPASGRSREGDGVDVPVALASDEERLREQALRRARAAASSRSSTG